MGFGRVENKAAALLPWRDMNVCCHGDGAVYYPPLKRDALTDLC